MTCEEFSNTFDTLLNSYNSQAEFGEGASKRDIVLDEYEKSVLLTQAQDIIVKTYFDRTLNNQGQGFDDSTRRQVDFSNLITVAELEEPAKTDKEGKPITLPTTFDSRGILYNNPGDLLVVLNEKLEFKKDGTIKSIATIVPINYKEYDRMMSKAYNQPLKRQAWRLFQGEKGNINLPITSEVIPIDNQYVGKGYTITYKMRYIRRPQPIVLVNFADDTTDWVDIDGVNKKTECELNPIVHMDILNKAVELAIITKGGGAAQQQQQQKQRAE